MSRFHLFCVLLRACLKFFNRRPDALCCHVKGQLVNPRVRIGHVMGKDAQLLLVAE
jgi:hypothetical protein